MASIELRGLSQEYGRGRNVVHAIAGIDLDIEEGEFVSVVGRSGSGKTTMLDCLGLLLRPSSGRVVLEGVDTGMLSDGRRAELRSRKIGFIFQSFNLLPSLNAMDNVLLPLRYSGGDRKAARKRAEDLFEQFGLADRRHHRPTQLSGGEQQRVAIARALVNQPALVLADEPTGEVDTETAEQLLEIMLRMNREHNVTFVIVTHDLDLAARTRRMIRLKDGQVISDEPVRSAKRKPKPAPPRATAAPKPRPQKPPRRSRTP